MKKRHNSNFSIRICLVFSVVLIFLIAGCKGPAGPMGPQGPAGPQGPQGEDWQYWASSTTINSQGSAQIKLPAEIGNKTPIVTYFMGYGDVWLVVASEEYGIACGLVFSNGRWYARITDGEAGWTFMVSVAW